MLAITIAAHPIAFIVPEVIAAKGFRSAVGDREANDRRKAEVVFVSACGATDTFKAICIRHDETPVLVLKREGAARGGPRDSIALLGVVGFRFGQNDPVTERQRRKLDREALCESASNLDPWRNRYNALQSNDFREKYGGHGWTPIEHARNKQFRFCFNYLVNNRGGVQVGRRFTLRAKRTLAALYQGSRLMSA
jgi:hypothetical protein